VVGGEAGHRRDRGPVIATRRGARRRRPLAQPVVVAAHVLHQPPVAFERDRARHHVIEEPPVVADDQQRARPFRQLCLQQLERLEVEVVGGLVEHQDIGRPREQPGQQQPVALAARQRLHGRTRPLWREQEVFEVAVDVAEASGHRHPIVAVADGVDDRALGVELFALLVVVGHLHVGAAPHRAGIGRQFAEQQPQQRGLAGAVGPDEADAVAAQHAGREVADHHPVAVRLGQVLGLEHQLARRVGGVERQLHGAHLRPPGRALDPHLQQPLHPTLVAGAARPDAAPQPDLLLGQLLVELLVGDRLALQPGRLLLQKRRVAAGPRGETAAVELDDAGRQPLEERAVVGDEQHGAGVLGQERLEPLDCLDVEVVGRLVEQQHVGGGHERPRQQHPAAPAARQRVHRGVGRQPQPGQHQLDPLLDAPAVALFELVLQPAHPLERTGVAVGHLHRGVVVRGDQRAQLAEAFGDDVEHRVVRVERHVLHQPRDPRPRRPPDRAAVGRDLAADDLQQGGLAGAVPADEGDTFTGVDRQRHVVEQRQVPVGMVQVIERD